MNPPTNLPDELDLHLPDWPQDVPLRPESPVSWEAVDAHFAPWVRAQQETAAAAQERLSRKVDVPFTWP